jgi:hypothetical protein
MSRPVTVRFSDGSSHIYEDVPDNISDQQVQERATTDFSKDVAGIGAKNEEFDTNAATMVAGAMQLPLQAAAAIGGPAALAFGVGRYGPRAWDAVKGIASGAAGAGATPTPGGPVAPGDAWSQKVTGSMGPGGDSVTEAARNYQLQKGLSPSEAAKYNVSRGGVMVPNQPVPPNPAQAARAVPAAPESWMTKAVQMGEQAMTKAAPAARGIADLAARYNPALVGAQLATHSTELGPKVPQSGPYRGMEINPRTGRGWSPEELNAIAHGRY